MDISRLVLRPEPPSYEEHLKENAGKHERVVPGNSLFGRWYVKLAEVSFYATPALCMLGILVVLPRNLSELFDMRTMFVLLAFGFWCLPRYYYPLIEWACTLTTHTPFTRALHVALCHPVHDLAPSDSRFWMVGPLVPLYWSACLYLMCHSPTIQVVGAGFLANVLWTNAMYYAYCAGYLENECVRLMSYAKHLHPSYFRERLFKPKLGVRAEQKENKQE